MEPHLIVIDLDGTLLLDFANYDEETFDYLRKLKKAGHIIMLATGRPKRSSYFVYEALGLDSPLINYNGALICNPKDEKYPKTDLRIDRLALLDIIDFIQDSMINVFCEIGDDIYVQDYNDAILPFLHIEGGTLHTGSLKTILPDNPNSALLFLKEGATEKLENYIKIHYHKTLLSRNWQIDHNYIVEIFNCLVDKSIGFIDACRYYHIPWQNTIAIGDGHNDIKLLQSAKTAVAMGNANPELIPYANYVTDRFDKQGVLKFLKHYFEEK